MPNKEVVVAAELSWWLVLEQEGAVPVAMPLPEGELTVGRGAEAGLALPSEKVSRLHAALVRHGDAVIVRDLGSKQGTLLNGASVEDEETVTAGDVITVDRFRLRLADRPPRVSEVVSPGAPSVVSVPGGTLDWGPLTAFLDRLRSSADAKSLVERLLLGLVELFGAERGFVLLRDGRGGKLVPVASHSIGDPDTFLAVSSTVYGKALEGRQVVVVHDSLSSDLCRNAMSLHDATPRTIVCAPLVTGGTAVGVIYVDQPLVGSHLDDGRIRLFETVTGLAAGILAEQQTRSRLVEARQRMGALTTLYLGGERLVLGDGPASRELNDLVEAAAAQEVTVLITGETGTGKEMVARTLHEKSPRRSGSFVAVNCAALPRDIIEAELFGAERGAYTGATETRMGRFELASGGTLFLDEVGELPMDVQVALLRVLEERAITRLGGTRRIPLDMRLVVATNRDLEAAVRDGSFRQDLYYRINVFRMRLRPLRERPEDVKPLAAYFLEYFAGRCGKRLSGFAPEAEKILLRHPWPGNIRELRNAVERAVVVERTGVITAGSLPLGGATVGAAGVAGDTESVLRDVLPRDYEEARVIFETTFLRRSLDESAGNITEAAKASGMTRCAIYRRLEKLGLAPKE